ncbi:MAG: hypothetical protein ABW277_12725 [Longimicrobiaceae bacterium]
MSAANGRTRAALAAAAAALALGGAARPAAAQWTRQHEQFYLPAEHNWVFRRNYPGADRLFNAFDYGHAILYEKLYRHPDAPASALEEREYDFVTRRLLVAPPRMPLEEGAIEVSYVKIAPEAKLMFEWAHLLHRQIYDVLGDERLSQAERDRAVAELLRYYRSRPEVAFSSRPKNMELMEGQFYSAAFREKYPRFNGLIWAYHWLQVGLYEPLLVGRTPDERQTGVTATVARFRQMLENAPANMPRLMPMTAAVAPRFAERYPEAAIIFDNLHGMHDVISDILASPQVPRDRKRAEILRAAERYRDDTSFVMTEREWRDMSLAMGVQNMGGPVTGFLAGFPAPTVERGAVMANGMAGMTSHGAMPHGQAGAAQPDHAGMQHGAVPAARAGDHAAMGHGALAPAPDSTDAARLAELQGRMMADPVIRARVAADSALRRMVSEVPGRARAADPGAARGTDADSAQALDFVVRLLADPEVEARIHSDPRLHALWSDPEVQRRLAELRRAQPARPAAPAADPHRH